jgi:hypothetical protein
MANSSGVQRFDSGPKGRERKNDAVFTADQLEYGRERIGAGAPFAFGSEKAHGGFDRFESDALWISL